MKLPVMCTHYNRTIEAILMSTLNIKLLCIKSLRFPYIFAICFLTWRHEYPSVARTTISRTNIRGPKHVRAIEVRLYLTLFIVI